MMSSDVYYNGQRPPTYGWSDEDRQTAVAMWRDGASAGAISHHFDGRHSRNAVIGIMHRAGIHRDEPARTSSWYPTRVKRGRQPKPARVAKPAPRTWPALIADVGLSGAIARMAADLPGMVHLLDTEKHHCRHIAGDDSMCCGQRIVPGLPYCEGHAVRCLRPVVRQENPSETRQVGLDKGPVGFAVRQLAHAHAYVAT